MARCDKDVEKTLKWLNLVLLQSMAFKHLNALQFQLNTINCALI